MNHENYDGIEAAVQGLLPRRPICPNYKKCIEQNDENVMKYKRDYTKNNYKRFELT